MGRWEGCGGVQGEAREGMAGEFDLMAADQECEATRGPDQGGGGGEDGSEAFDGAKGDEVKGSRGQGFGAGVLYIDVRQCKSAGDLAQEGGFLVIGFDERQADGRRPEFQGDAGESGAGSDVGNGRG